MQLPVASRGAAPSSTAYWRAPKRSDPERRGRRPGRATEQRRQRGSRERTTSTRRSRRRRLSSSLPIFGDQRGAFRMLAPTEHPPDASGDRAAIDEIRLRGALEDELQLGLQRAAVPCGARLQTVDRFVVQIPNQYLSHGSPRILLAKY